MPTQVPPSGPIPARVMVVGEAPGADEERYGEPFVGASGNELTRMLQEAGIARSECFITNVARERPLGNDIGNFIPAAKKDRSAAHQLYRGRYVTQQITYGAALLEKEILLVKPNIIIALGNTPLWALTGEWGIQRWRGSMLRTDFFPYAKVIPTFHPSAVLRQWEWRGITVHDLRRAAEFRSGAEFPDPRWHFLVRPSYSQASSLLLALAARLDAGEALTLSFDLETKFGHIDCAGIAWTEREAICIPFLSRQGDGHYWNEEEEASLVHIIYRLLTHKNAFVVGQNLLYDSQYTYRHWHFIPNVKQDTMISWHVAFPALPKKLDFQASMLCKQYKQWKPDRSAWKEGG